MGSSGSPEDVVRPDQAAHSYWRAPQEIRGARIAAQQAIAFSRGETAARRALIDAVPGLIVASGGKLTSVLIYALIREPIGIDFSSGIFE